YLDAPNPRAATRMVSTDTFQGDGVEAIEADCVISCLVFDPVYRWRSGHELRRFPYLPPHRM
ncbi:hypothetical protein ACT01L_28620, partial [Klebsiella pneumoniae]|uniref:hypothetical protein n=1 Tax=Klebsiella pneumoniae TaxID=573 RepID=UPI00402BF01A